MIRLFLFFILVISISLIGVASIKIFIVLLTQFWYAAEYPWSMDDLRFIITRGLLMSAIFCTLGLIWHIKGKR